LKLANLAFSTNDTRFFGGGPGAPHVPSSFQTILHEVGHAVERENLRSAQESHLGAEAQLEVVRQRQKDYDATAAADQAAAKKKGTAALNKFWKERGETYNRNTEAVTSAQTQVNLESDKIRGTQVPASIVQPLVTEAAAKGTAASNALAAAKSAIPQTLNAAEIQSSQAYVTAIEATAAAITTFVHTMQGGQADVDDLEPVVLQKAGARDTAKPRPPHKAIALFAPVVQAQDAWFEAERKLARTRLRTRRLQKFIELVARNNIRRFTKYSVDNWQLKPGEFYAEAYSLWLVDPAFLKNNYSVVYDFFQNGEYRR
jgi:hypothetical protein